MNTYRTIRWCKQTLVFLVSLLTMQSLCSFGFYFALLSSEESVDPTAERIKWPDQFPINMGFKTLLSATNAKNHYFDTLENAGLYAMHHTGRNPANSIKNTYGTNIISIVMNPGSVDGENRSGRVDYTSTGKVWPGFWLQKAGTLLTQSITGQSTQLAVEDASRFSTNNWVMISSLRADGKPSWFSLPSGVPSGQSTSYYQDTFLPMFDYAKVIQINIPNNQITVERGKTGTVPNSYTGGQAVVAAMLPGWEAEGDEGKVITQFKNNYSLVAPRHPGTGENAAEFWSRGIVAAMNANINDGTESDVQHCLVDASADVDCDRVVDGGFIDSVNVYALGYQEYSRLYREGVGPKKIIQLDSIRARNGYRGFKYVNGVQMETFQGGAWFSDAFDMLEQWVQKAEATPAFSYGYCRARTETYGGVAGADNLFRKQFAVGLLLGMPHPYGSSANFGLFDWDEQRGGNLNNYTWLGKALGPYQRDLSAMGTTDLIAGKSWTVQVDSGFAATSSGSVTDSGGLQINVNTVPGGGRVYRGVRVKYNEPQMQLAVNSPYTLVFDAKSTDVVEYQGKSYGGMPGFIQIEEHGTTGKRGLLTTSGWRTYRIGFPTGANAKFRAEFGLGEGKCNFWIKNIRLYSGSPDRLWRDFENGRVYLNESHTAWTVNLGTNVFWRLRGDINPDLHDGSLVTGTIIVPVQDAVYLLKHSPRLEEPFDYSAGQSLTAVSDQWELLRGGNWTVKNDVTNETGQIDFCVAPPTGTALVAVKTNVVNQLDMSIPAIPGYSLRSKKVFISPSTITARPLISGVPIPTAA